MSLDLDPACDKSRAKTVKLAGQEFTIAPMKLRSIMALPALLPKLSAMDTTNITAEMFEPFLDVMVLGLSAAYPKVTKDDLLDLPITLGELVDAAPIIIEQAGGTKRDAAAGEAGATSQTTTSTDSSPSS